MTHIAARENHPRTRVGVLIVRGDELLLVKHRRDDHEYWLLPGGGLDYGESIHDCAVRECKEELGLDVEVGDIIAVTESLPPQARRHILHIVLQATSFSGQEQLGQDDKRLVDMGWHPIEALRELTFYPPIAEEMIAAARGGGPRLPDLGPRWT